MPTKILNVPANIISGFLGVGKTTAVLDLFSKKPAAEKWAVLVNEFGKVGIDGHIYQANGITVKEIPGGCMCCAQGLPLQVAINRLLRETEPDRLIIESSGIGHPDGVLKTLKGEGFNDVLELKASICLVDPEFLIDPDYQQNELFQEQIQFSDVLIANKTDLASAKALQHFQQLAESLKHHKQYISTTIHGQLDIDWLELKHQSHTKEFSFTQLKTAPQSEWQTHTFHFPASTLFDIDELKRCLKKHSVTRLKGIVQTAENYHLLNYSSGQVDIKALPRKALTPEHSYIEVIDKSLNIAELDTAINSCISSK